MKILLTGSSGQLGNALLPQLSKLATVYAPLRQELDLANPAQLRRCIQDFKPDLIINPAAYTAVDLAETEKELAHTINVDAPACMAEEAHKLGAGLVHYSTDYVFDGEKRDAQGDWQAYLESDATNPQNVYGQTKLAGELAIAATACRHLILRTSWVYSLHGKNFLLTMLKLAREREHLRVVNDQWGVPNSAAWLAQATGDILASLFKTEDPTDWWQSNAGTYHLSAGGKTNWCEFAAAIIAIAGQQNSLGKTAPALQGIASSEYPTAARRPKNSMLNTQKIQTQFQLHMPDWQTCLQQCMQELQPLPHFES
ncbi:dTDP-4-dehydrorhamnose reductase [Undibacterium sp. TJN19]|uniref:dTDP-4-dehydrorhamnose reductase n=1 Tax=Undibacterium sp. TJN19 TaxID=3413055 RepID=UPI003BF232C8